MRLRTQSIAALREYAALLAAVVSCVLFSLPAQASSDFPAISPCHISAKTSDAGAAIAQDRSAWECSDTLHDRSAPVHIVRFDLEEFQSTSEIPKYLVVERYTAIEMEASFVGMDGSLTSQRITSDQISVGKNAAQATISLPATDAPASALLLVVEDAAVAEAMLSAQIAREPPVKTIAGQAHLLVAVLCGLLIAPLFFDLGFYQALREKFPLHHAIFCLTAFVQTLASSGLLLLLTPLSFETVILIHYISFDCMLAATAIFVCSFIEPFALDRRHRRVLVSMAVLVLAIGTLITFGHRAMGDFAVLASIAIYGLYLCGSFFVLNAALRRGSRAARFVALAFAPLLVIGVLAVTGAILPALALDFDRLWAQNLALLFEVVVTAFAVADRFLSIKRQRDHAVSEARSMEALSERDALTGLLNRRALSMRFEALRAQGFTGMAVVDLDHFKSINDTYGHQVGDDVLKAAAGALMTQSDDDLLAFRIGGEEFLLLLRGRAMQARAEGRRVGISTAIANETSIDRRVTASMGFLEASSDALENASFEALYERADRLLYEAKEHGRDRMIAVKVKVFRRRAGRRAEAA